MANVDARKIAGNTITMYIRTLVTMIIALYTSRVILKNLGVVDFGVYNIVGGVVTLLSVFTNSLNKVSVRFISYEIGKQEERDIQSVFSLCVYIHAFLAFLIVIIGASLKDLIIPLLNIPVDRVHAAESVFLYSVLAFGFNVIKIPFDSLLISFEKMNYYAILGIIDSILKLIVAIIIGYVIGDRLSSYALFITVASFVLLFSTITICFLKIGCYHFSGSVNKDLLRQYFTFIGWSMLGGSVEAVTVNAFAIVVNIFYGVVVNAALGIMNQVQSAVTRFLSSFSMSYTPQVIKSYAERETALLYKLICSSSKISFILISAISLPLIINMDYILGIWLTEVPQYTASFCRVILFCTMIDALTSVYNTAITATGRIKQYNIFLSISFITCLAFTIAIAYYRVSPVYVVVLRLFTLGILNMLIGWHEMKNKLNFDIRFYVDNVLIKVLFLLVVGVLLYIPLLLYSHSLLRLVLTIPIALLYILIAYWLTMNYSEKKLVKKMIEKIITIK